MTEGTYLPTTHFVLAPMHGAWSPCKIIILPLFSQASFLLSLAGIYDGPRQPQSRCIMSLSTECVVAVTMIRGHSFLHIAPLIEAQSRRERVFLMVKRLSLSGPKPSAYSKNQPAPSCRYSSSRKGSELHLMLLDQTGERDRLVVDLKQTCDLA